MCVELQGKNIRVELPSYKVEIDNVKLPGTMMEITGVKNNNLEYDIDEDIEIGEHNNVEIVWHIPDETVWYAMNISLEPSSPQVFLMVANRGIEDCGLLIGLSENEKEGPVPQNSQIVKSQLGSLGGRRVEVLSIAFWSLSSRSQ